MAEHLAEECEGSSTSVDGSWRQGEHLAERPHDMAADQDGAFRRRQLGVLRRCHRHPARQLKRARVQKSSARSAPAADAAPVLRQLE
jgi:hypothetical protein